ncbi:MAG: YhbY family RNA-binding protein [Candidatus Methanomethylophilaceae archaeon]|nr:YhbY family RNA-binding protein [Candidatus Methanomethylophilaceae archaeon]MBQ7978912.1 YhbY family RNA-binding protein [Candidatus Methanomethylophilaceae archaeon]MBQ9689973.1 YhbY family RNA-binding protein [Candidatus Methanomethylophilaceae archaeon]MBR4203672.1 YhbY family RNA-binding protein [Candidatus Methanomethylophilaceae archaeon]MBR6911531.1 YhbY family RNA-binding protein [Candidatus Methanomethylophilaceae archaeon]
MTEKDARKELMRRANEINPTVHVGKDGLDQGLFEEITAQLKKNRLIKVKVLSNSDEGAKDAAAAIEENTGAVIVDVRGGVIVVTDKRTWTSLSQKKF